MRFAKEQSRGQRPGQSWSAWLRQTARRVSGLLCRDEGGGKAAIPVFLRIDLGAEPRYNTGWQRGREALEANFSINLQAMPTVTRPRLGSVPCGADDDARSGL